jgi:hypothetical protein
MALMVNSVILTVYGVLKTYKIPFARSSGSKRTGHSGNAVISPGVFEFFRMFVFAKLKKEEIMF